MQPLTVEASSWLLLTGSDLGRRAKDDESPDAIHAPAPRSALRGCRLMPRHPGYEQSLGRGRGANRSPPWSPMRPEELSPAGSLRRLSLSAHGSPPRRGNRQGATLQPPTGTVNTSIRCYLGSNPLERRPIHSDGCALLRVREAHGGEPQRPHAPRVTQIGLPLDRDLGRTPGDDAG